MNLDQELKRQIQGEVLSSPEEIKKYSVDESIFEITPSAVVAPKNKDDLKTILQIAKHFRLSVTARGGGTSVAGQSIGPGIILDFSKHFSKVLNISDGKAVVEPGIVLDELNEKLAKKGARFAPDPSSHAWCTLGGMVGNNASGPHALQYGDTRKATKNLKVMLADGSLHDTKDLSKIFVSLTETIRKKSEEIQKRIPKTTKNSSGYSLESLLKKEEDYAGLIVGSEGTLCLTTEIEIETIPLPKKRTTMVFSFDSVEEAAEKGVEFRSFRPSAIEIMNHWIIQALQTQDSKMISDLKLEKGKASLWVEWEGEVPADVKRQGILLSDIDSQKHIWQLRSLASKILHDLPGTQKPLRCIEDGVVPLKELKTYVIELQEILKRHRCEGAIFGHVGDAHIHVNPRIDIEQPHLGSRLEKLMDEVYALVLKLGGSISGEHGDGILRQKYVAQQWGGLTKLFEQVKKEFDPDSIFNTENKKEAAKLNENWLKFKSTCLSRG